MDQVVILFKCAPFQNDLLLKERICSQREVTLSLKEQFLKVEKLTFTALGDRLEFYYLIIHVRYCVANGS